MSRRINYNQNVEVNPVIQVEVEVKPTRPIRQRRVKPVKIEPVKLVKPAKQEVKHEVKPVKPKVKQEVKSKAKSKESKLNKEFIKKLLKLSIEPVEPILQTASVEPILQTEPVEPVRLVEPVLQVEPTRQVIEVKSIAQLMEEQIKSIAQLMEERAKIEVNVEVKDKETIEKKLNKILKRGRPVKYITTEEKKQAQKESLVKYANKQNDKMKSILKAKKDNTNQCEICAGYFTQFNKFHHMNTKKHMDKVNETILEYINTNDKLTKEKKDELTILVNEYKFKNLDKAKIYIIDKL